MHEAFDAAVSAITFPDAAKSDSEAVLNADTKFVAALGTLSVNTDNIANYNSLFATAAEVARIVVELRWRSSRVDGYTVTGSRVC